ncbi:MAG: hypothetical protein R3C28_04730 [Pirellulaceae bacterium]
MSGFVTSSTTVLALPKKPLRIFGIRHLIHYGFGSAEKTAAYFGIRHLIHYGFGSAANSLRILGFVTSSTTVLALPKNR